MTQTFKNQHNWTPSNLGTSFYASLESDKGFVFKQKL